MDQKALTPLAKDAYSYGAEQGFRLGYLAAGEVIAAATREHHRRAGEYLRDELRRRFDEVAARSMAAALEATQYARTREGKSQRPVNTVDTKKAAHIWRPGGMWWQRWFSWISE